MLPIKIRFNLMRNFFTIIILFVSNLITAQNFANEITISQNQTNKIITKENEPINLKKQPFTIQFQSKFHNSKKENFNGLKITIVKNEADLQVIEEGNPINLIPFFEEVSAVLPDSDGFYSSAVISDYVHHYLFYENDTNKSIQLISKKNEIGLFEWTVDRFYLDGKEFPIESLKENKLTFILLNDFNSNKIIDTDELRILRIQFD